MTEYAPVGEEIGYHLAKGGNIYHSLAAERAGTENILIYIKRGAGIHIHSADTEIKLGKARFRRGFETDIRARRDYGIALFYYAALFVCHGLVHRMYHNAEHIGNGTGVQARILIEREQIFHRVRVGFSISNNIAFAAAKISAKPDYRAALAFSAHVGVLALAKVPLAQEKHKVLAVFGIQRVYSSLDIIYASVVLRQALFIRRLEVAEERENIVFIAVCQIMVLKPRYQLAVVLLAEKKRRHGYHHLVFAQLFPGGNRRQQALPRLHKEIAYQLFYKFVYRNNKRKREQKCAPAAREHCEKQGKKRRESKEQNKIYPARKAVFFQ